MIPCLRNWDLVLINCEVDGDVITAEWVQVNPAKINEILGTEQEVKQAKVTDSPTYKITVPTDTLEVCTNARFPLVSVADS